MVQGYEPAYGPHGMSGGMGDGYGSMGGGDGGMGGGYEDMDDNYTGKSGVGVSSFVFTTSK